MREDLRKHLNPDAEWMLKHIFAPIIFNPNKRISNKNLHRLRKKNLKARSKGINLIINRGFYEVAKFRERRIELLLTLHRRMESLK